MKKQFKLKIWMKYVILEPRKGCKATWCIRHSKRSKCKSTRSYKKWIIHFMYMQVKAGCAHWLPWDPNPNNIEEQEYLTVEI